MNTRTFARNLTNKTPKLLFVVVLLYALSLHKGMLFGISDRPQGEIIPLPARVTEDFFGEPVTLTTADSVWYKVHFARNATGSEEPAGYAICGKRETNAARGFGGAVPVVIFLDAQQVVRGVRMLENTETRTFSERLTATGFFEQWNGTSLHDPLPQVDASSGATYTSMAVVANVQQTVAALLDHSPPPSRGRLLDYLGEAAILCSVAAGLLAFLAPAMMRRWRIPLLVLTIGVLGIWQGAFVSLDLLYKWVAFGTSPLERFGLFGLVALSLALPLLTNKAFYCTYVCPFGNIQELMGKCLKHKRGIPPKVLHIALWVRRVFLAGMVVALFAVQEVDWAAFEPFTVFIFQAAAVSSVAIAAISLVASLFFQRPWCRIFCPTGEILSLLRRPMKYPGKKKD